MSDASPNADRPESERPESERSDDAADAPASDASDDERNPDSTPEPIDLLQPFFRESPVRPEGAEAPPTWLWMTIFGVILFSTFYLGSYIGDFSPDPWLQSSKPVAQTGTPAPKPEVSGSSIYNARCANCHQGNGQGVANAFPPLVDTRWVEDKGQIIRILLQGLQGPIEVKGNTYNGNMPAWGTILSDEEIAAVITHVRQSWDNDYSEVTAEEVAAVREATQGRAQPWFADELDQDENRTVPSTAPDAPAEEPTAANGMRLYEEVAFATNH